MTEEAATEAAGGPMVVGIGASAGGLAALRSLFEAMPSDSGLAFVVVVHLSPQHESHMADVLQRYSDMPVLQVTDTMQLEPDHVYVIPPGRNLNTIDSHLRLSELEEKAQQRAPIDHFFKTLSETHDSAAIGVVLTGTGSDGTTGLEYIKDRGGLTIVQDPEEAEYDGMPRSAIASGFVDRIVPLEEMPELIVGFAETTPDLAVPADGEELSPEAERALQRILAQVRNLTGHDMTGYKRTTLLRRLRRRMQLHRRERIDEYLALLREDPEEARRLFDDLLISVTGFFRDAAVYDHLEQNVIPELLARKGPEDTVRVWTVGCSTGEEAYSLAILLLEAASGMDNPPMLQVFATDLADGVLQRAREGVYPEQIEADVSPARLARFFTAHADGYRVKKEVRNLVVFAPHNLLRDPPFSHLDLVSCRNLLIYLQRAVQRNVIELFHYALDPGGHLVLGSAESLDQSSLFVPVHKGYCIFRRLDVDTKEPKLPVFALGGVRATSTGRTRDLAHGTVEGSGRLHEKMVEQYAPPSILVNDDHQVVHLSAHAGGFLAHPGGDPTNDLLRLVRSELRIELRAALYAARERMEPVTSKPVRMAVDGSDRSVTVRVRPATGDKLGGLWLVIFDDVPASEPSAGAEPGERDITVVELETELDLAERRLQALIDQYETSQEEMKASNEEMQSTNEELRSTLEELETSKEELQSVNEELTTLNQENRHKVDELRLLSSDLQNLLVGTDIATLFLDRNLRIMRFTPRVGELFNIRNTDRGRPLTDLTHQLGYSELIEDAREVLDRLAPVEREVESQDERWFLTRVLPYRTTDDRIDGVVITFVDITRRREAEWALRESEARMRVALEASRMGAWSWDAADDVFAGDLRTIELFGLSTDDPVTFDHVTARAVAEDRSGLRDALSRATDAGDRFDVEVRTPDAGSVRWLLVSGQGYTHEGRSSTVRVAGTVLDITDRKATEQSLAREVELQTETVRQSERRFRALVEASSQIVWTTDAQGLVVADSPAWRDFTGQSFGGLHGSGWLAAVHPGDAEDVERSWREAVGDRQQLHAEFRLWHAPTEEWRWVVARSVPIHEEGGPLLGWVGMVTDVHERRRAEEQLRHLASTATMIEHEERRRIARVLHDDLQQRLYSVRMKASQLADELVEETDERRVDEIQELLADSIELTHNLTVDLSPPILQGEGLVDALGWLASQMEEMHGLRVDVRGENSAAMDDEHDLRVFLFQIVRELLFNVVKHAGTDSARVELVEEGDRLEIRVVDGGVGFSMTDVGATGRSGTGLSRTRERLRLFGGSMEVESEPGTGTTVTVTLPHVRAER